MLATSSASADGDTKPASRDAYEGGEIEERRAEPLPVAGPVARAEMFAD